MKPDKLKTDTNIMEASKQRGHLDTLLEDPQEHTDTRKKQTKIQTQRSERSTEAICRFIFEFFCRKVDTQKEGHTGSDKQKGRIESNINY